MKRRRKSTSSEKKQVKKPRVSKKLKKIRVVDGKNKDEVIMVSIADYETLIRSGLYEPVKEEVGRKKVYGKKESPYKHRENTTSGPRQRTVLNSLEMEPEDAYALFDDYSNFEETEDVRITPLDDRNEEGWSF